MSALVAVLVGLALGAAGALAHLVIVRWRAGLAGRRGVAVSLAALPLGLAAPAAAVLVAARVAPLAAWVTPLGILGARAAVLGRLRRLDRAELPSPRGGVRE